VVASPNQQGGSMRKFVPVRALAVVALAGSAIAGAVVATSSVATAAKGPVSATCSSIAGSSTIAAITGGQPASSVISGCAGAKTTAQGVDVSTVNSSQTGGSGTIFWENKTTTTYTFTTASASLTCPTFLGVAATGSETLTLTVTGGKSKVTAPGSFGVCYYVGSDSTIYEASVGSITL
jgi:hypothetical protein